MAKSKSEYIVIHNAEFNDIGNGEIIVYGRIHSTHLAGKRLLKKFSNEMVKFAVDSNVYSGCPTITNTPRHEIETIRTKLSSKRDVMSCAVLTLSFTDGVLNHAYVRDYTAD
jgi:hypothetical protein